MKTPIFLSIVYIITPLVAMQDAYIPGLPNDMMPTIITQLVRDASYFEIEQNINALLLVNKRYYSLMNSHSIISIVKKCLDQIIEKEYEHNMSLPMELKAIYCDMPLYLHCCIKTAVDPNAFLLQKYAEMYENETLLHCAVSFYAERCAQYLLRYTPIDITARNINDETPLHYTAFNFKPDLVHLLLAHGADINALDYEQETPLSHAVCLDTNEIGLALLEYACNVNTKNYKGDTPLHKALHAKADQDIIRKLIEKGASINEPNNAGMTPAQYALDHYDPGYLVYNKEN
jgi:Ankyrin repeats (3 copies)/Ankyrin repeats (many copies)